jgi:hypothetical protein
MKKDGRLEQLARLATCRSVHTCDTQHLTTGSEEYCLGHFLRLVEIQDFLPKRAGASYEEQLVPCIHRDRFGMEMLFDKFLAIQLQRERGQF